MTSIYPDHHDAFIGLAATFPENVQRLARHVIDRLDFAACSGSVSAGKHHYGTGGLQRHTWEVVNLIGANRVFCEVSKDVSADQAFLAGLFHDVGKIWDYQLEPDPMRLYGPHGIWSATPHKRLINHMNRSALFWVECATREGFDQTYIDEVLHSILAHHAEHGSSVMPKTKLAWLLHLCDQLSAWMDQCDRRDPFAK